MIQKVGSLQTNGYCACQNPNPGQLGWLVSFLGLYVQEQEEENAFVRLINALELLAVPSWQTSKAK